MEGVRMGEQGADFMGNGLLWKRDRGLVEMDKCSGDLSQYMI